MRSFKPGAVSIDRLAQRRIKAATRRRPRVAPHPAQRAHHAARASRARRFTARRLTGAGSAGAASAASSGLDRLAHGGDGRVRDRRERHRSPLSELTTRPCLAHARIQSESVNGSVANGTPRAGAPGLVPT
jgi:hypothetical protein